MSLVTRCNLHTGKGEAKLFKSIWSFSDFLCSDFSPKIRAKKKPTPVKYEVGDLVWAKFNRRPWWPCTICHDPVLDCHSKMKGTVSTQTAKWRSCIVLY